MEKGEGLLLLEDVLERKTRVFGATHPSTRAAEMTLGALRNEAATGERATMAPASMVARFSG